MTLTLGTGPLSRTPGGAFNVRLEGPGQVIYLEDSPRRVRVELAGETIAQSERMKLLHETGHLPVYYFPVDDVRWDHLERSEHTSRCPFKGEAIYWSVRAGARVAERAVWRYPEPIEGCPDISGHVAFTSRAMDAWFEEDERIEVHPRDPYHRVDVRRSARHVRVLVRGEPVADTRRSRVLFETGLPPRIYVPPEDVLVGIEPSDKVTHCPYKGTAGYGSVTAGGELARDVVWSYDDPLPEALAVQGYRCFLGPDVAIEVDGEPRSG